MARIFIARDLEARAGYLVTDTVDEVARQAEELAKGYAPPTKIWRTMRDDKVRPEHRALEGKEEAGQIRFKAKSFKWDKENRAVGEHTYLLAPRDRSSRSLIHVRQCRCYLQVNNGVAEGIKRTEAIIKRDSVEATVVSSSEWAVDAEYGQAYPSIGKTSKGEYYMKKAEQTMKTRLGIT